MTNDFSQSLLKNIKMAPTTKPWSVPIPIFSNSPDVISVLYITYLFMVYLMAL
jgi:hypothetical protein